jgi:multicomponent Na+:H+ antiporter subunit G
MMALIADLFLLLGSTSIVIGSIGLLRMPDVYNRLQAGTKTATLGALALLLGIALHHPDWWSKLLVIAGFILFTNPVGSSTIARAARSTGIPVWSKENKAENNAENNAEEN